ncbi:flagellar hook-associated protein FlgK [Azohydromonas aeria]|uniref:flagellar hook-associated protein FlgK n=1 Tax=Azohydromonas aeria TaxID=2590212 RepID=UPI001E2F2459|nr:flagellar hook-associated protein FlgK [Azohydromonas aeria]
MAFSLMSVGARAMSASYAALQTTSHNIANASVEGYSRQQASLETALAQRSGSGFLGHGVNVATITRAHNAFLSREAVNTNSLAALDGTHLRLLSQLEGAFPTGEAGVGQAASNFFGALSDLASTPADTAVRQVVLSRAGELAQRFSSAGAQLESMQSGVVSDLKGAVTTVNGLSRGIAQLNTEIVRQQALGQPPNDLLDKRDQMVHELGGYLQVSTVSGPDGSLAVFAAGGQRLVLGNEAQPLEAVTDKLDPSRAALALREVDGSLRPLDSATLTGGGSIGALLRFQNQDLVAARNTLGQMAVAVSAGLNQQQALGLDLRQPSGTGQPIFTDFVQQSQAGALRGQPAATNSRDAAGNLAASVAIRIGDASLLEADEYTLQSAGGGGFLMTRRSDGQRFTTADGSSFAAEGTGADFRPGFTLDLNGTMAAGDRFLLQPVGTAASNLRVVLDDPRGIAAAAPVTAKAAGANKGTGSVSALAVTDGAAFDPALKLQGSLRFTDASGAYQYDWEQRDAGGGVVASGSLTGTWSSGQPLQLGGVQLSLIGKPSANDSFTLATTVNPAANNGNALALAGLDGQALLGRSWGAGGNTGGTTLTDAWANALSSVGTRVQTARTASDISSGVASDARAARDSNSGVNLDEEAARLIQFQQGYQAAAKVLQVAQSVFDSLLQATGR